MTDPMIMIRRDWKGKIPVRRSNAKGNRAINGPGGKQWGNAKRVLIYSRWTFKNAKTHLIPA